MTVDDAIYWSVKDKWAVIQGKYGTCSSAELEVLRAKFVTPYDPSTPFETFSNTLQSNYSILASHGSIKCESDKICDLRKSVMGCDHLNRVPRDYDTTSQVFAMLLALLGIAARLHADGFASLGDAVGSEQR